MNEYPVRPIFVLGAAHSGTTILFRLLGLHHEIAWFSQFSQRSGGVPDRFRLPFHRYANRGLRKLFRHDWKKRPRGIRDYLVPRPGEANRVWNFLLPPGGERGPETVDRLRRVFLQECRDWNRHYLLSKLPRLSGDVQILERAFPQARFIHIVRDGRAVALSCRHKFQRDTADPETALVHSGSYWLRSVQGSRGLESSDRLWEIRYEDFCTDPRAAIRQALGFVGVDANAFPYDRCPQRLRVSNPRWFRRATDDELGTLDALLSDELKRYDYPQPPPAAQRSSADQ